MMKRFFCSVLLTVTAAVPGIAQEEVLSLDNQGKYIYYQVASAPEHPRDTLKARAGQFFSASDKTVLINNTSDSTFSARGRFMVYKTAAAVLSHPSGEVSYRLVLELASGRYRYWLTDFKFIPYSRDRYGNFVPVSVFGLPLEKPPGKLNDSEWNSYLADTGRQAEKVGKAIEYYLSGKAQLKITDKPVQTGKW